MRNKRGKKHISFFQSNFFPKNQKGQFYLIAAVILVAMILGFVTISNNAKKKDFAKIYDFEEELKIEAEAVLDYAIKNEPADINGRLETFTRNYSNYSEAENLYFVFGDQTLVNIAAYRKSTPATILVNVGGGNVELDIPEKTYILESYTSPINPVSLTINEIPYEFTLKTGKNFYFIISQGTEEEEDYVFTGSVIKESQ